MFPSRRVRATLLLQLVVAAASIAVFALTAWIVGTLTTSVFALLGLYVFWVIGMQLGALPYVLERIAMRRAEASGRPVESIWFYSVEAKRAAQVQKWYDDTEDHPTIR